MIRSKMMIKPGMDRLESRQVMASGGPSDQAQYMLELMNEARANPVAATQRVISDDNADLNLTMSYYGDSVSSAISQLSQIPAKQPLGWNDKLAASATMQSQYQADTGTQTHSGPNGMDLNARMASKGYDGEVNSTENAFAYSKSVDHAMQAFLLDWGVADKGHRRNLLQGNVGNDQSFNEVGIGIVATSNKNLGPLVITQDFARSSAKPTPKLLGVIYNDSDHNNFYTPGEGVDQVLIRAQNLSTNEVTTTTNWDSGGYQMDLQPGQYRVSARRGMKSLGVQNVTVGDQNVKLDFVADPDNSPTITDSNPESPSPKVQAAGTPASKPTLNGRVNSTRFDSSAIHNWSTWKPKG
ncbi:MAG: CAP domain-containing protein [Planctomycetota bacterium]